MEKLFVVYETVDENWQPSAHVDAIPKNDNILWWLNSHQAVNCLWFPSRKEAVATANFWNESYRTNKEVNK